MGPSIVGVLCVCFLDYCFSLSHTFQVYGRSSIFYLIPRLSVSGSVCKTTVMHSALGSYFSFFLNGVTHYSRWEQHLIKLRILGIQPSLSYGIFSLVRSHAVSKPSADVACFVLYRQM